MEKSIIGRKALDGLKKGEKTYWTLVGKNWKNGW
jgi:hypothetical protein